MIEYVVTQHAIEAASLWPSRRGATKAPHCGLANLAKIDGRVEAHLDGLRIAGDDGWSICEKQLEAKEEGEVFAAGSMAFESGNPEHIAKVMAVVEEEPVTGDGLVSALGWLPVEQAQVHIQNFLKNENPVHQQVGIAGAAVHRRPPGQVLAEFARSPNPGVRARALKAIGEFGDINLTSHLEFAFGDADVKCRFAAAWAGALLAMPQAVPVLCEIAESGDFQPATAAMMALRRMDLNAAQSWQKWLSSDLKHMRLAIGAAGVIGNPSIVPWLISLMGDLPLARLAGESFTMITGADLAYRELDREPPEDFSAGPSEDPKDENVEMDPDDNLPWPDPALVEKWWDRNRGGFRSEARYLLGKPMSIDWLRTVLRDGRQRHRAAAAVELAIQQPGQPLFNIAAPGFRQQQTLGKGELIR